MGSILNLVYDNIRVEKKMYETSFTKYSENFDIRLYHVSEVTDSVDQKFFYVFTHNDYIFSNITNNGLPFTKEVSDLLKTTSNFYFIFFNEMESDTENCLEYLESELKNNGYSPTKFYVINSNQKLPELKLKYNSNLNVRISDVGNYSTSKHLQMYRHEFNEDREHLFMFYNRNVKPHRVSAMSFLKKYNALDNFDWSWLRGDDFKKITELNNNLTHWFSGILNYNDIDNIKEEIDFLKNIDIKKSIHENYVVDFPPHFIDWDVMYRMNPYSHSYLNIICETNYIYNDIIHITEKCFSPLYFFQIPIVFSSCNHMKYLKEKYGFDLFEDIVNHEYDNEPDNRKRFFMIIDEIMRLNTMKKEIIEYFKNNVNRFQQNRNIIIKIAESNNLGSIFEGIS